MEGEILYQIRDGILIFKKIKEEIKLVGVKRIFWMLNSILMRMIILIRKDSINNTLELTMDKSYKKSKAAKD